MNHLVLYRHHNRTLVEQIIQHPTSLRYIGTTTQDDFIQAVFLDIHHSANQPSQQTHVTLYCQWSVNNNGASTESISMHAAYIINDSLTSLSSSRTPPFISRQDMRINLDHNTYDTRTRTLDITYHCDTSDTSDDSDLHPTLTTTPASPNINIQRHVSLHSPSTHSRSWDPPQDPVLPSSLRRHDFMSSSLVFRPSSPGSVGHRLPHINVSKRLSTMDLSSSYSSSSTTHPTSPHASSKGEQLVIDIGADNNNTVANLTLQLLDSDNNPTLNNQFAQLCLRCVKYYPFDSVSSSRYSLILHHPDSLMNDLKLLQDTTKLTVRLVLVLRHGSGAPSGDLQLLLDGKQWPVRNTMPWEVAIDDSEEDDMWDGKPVDDDDDMDTDPFMDSMEDVQGSTTTTIDQDLVSQSSPIRIPSNKTTLEANVSMEHPESNNKPYNTTATQEQPKSKPQKPKDIIVDDLESTAAISLQRPPSSGKKIHVPHVDPPELIKAYQYFDALLHSNDWHITQKPDQNNGFATIKKMDVEGHPTGVLMCETIWQHCSIWDAKAVLSCSEAREICKYHAVIFVMG
ncbi:hypothetical protein BC941DRAFT_62761 [Chlamydoabsidia padenii]|nr:hypothetical protein BC941DRAFT_62761 [Chlamydoabsidia padenii]